MIYDKCRTDTNISTNLQNGDVANSSGTTVALTSMLSVDGQLIELSVPQPNIIHPSSFMATYINRNCTVTFILRCMLF